MAVKMQRMSGSIRPEDVKRSESSKILTGWEIERLLLERVILRKEIKLEKMQRKLDRQTKLIVETEKEYLQQSSSLRKTEEKWREAETILQIHQSLPGFRIYLCFCSCISTIMQIFSKIRSSLFSTLLLGVQVNYCSLVWWYLIYLSTYFRFFSGLSAFFQSRQVWLQRNLW